MNRRSLVAISCGAALLLAACGEETTSGPVSPDGTTAVSGATAVETVAQSAITIDGAWARTSPMNVDIGAAYMEITSAADDKLLSASVDPSVAGKVEVHEVVMAETEMPMTSDMSMTSEMPMTTEAPMMQMRQVEFIELPAGEVVKLQPGGYHIMLLELAAPLELGQEFDVTLTFEQAGDVTIKVVVADDAP